jgi:hypothetical protein
MILELLFLSRIKERKRKGKEGRKEERESRKRKPSGTVCVIPCE